MNSNGFTKKKPKNTYFKQKERYGKMERLVESYWPINWGINYLETNFGSLENPSWASYVRNKYEQSKSQLQIEAICNAILSPSPNRCHYYLDNLLSHYRVNQKASFPGRPRPQFFASFPSISRVDSIGLCVRLFSACMQDKRIIY